jgi:hypothetical protein|nr:hypothetical protein [Kofleriaceae bacterium]
MKLAAVVLASIVAFGSSVSFADDVAKLARDREAAVAAVYPALEREFEAAKRTPSELGAWSVRWLDATLDAGGAVDKAFADHLARMTEVEKREQAMVKSGLAPTSDLGIATYYKAEAALWKARGKK